MRSPSSLFTVALLAGLLASLTAPAAAQDAALLYEFAGDLSMVRGGSGRQPVERMPLEAGDQLNTKCATAWVKAGDAYAARMLSRSRYEVLEPLGAAQQRLMSGRLRVAAQGGRHLILGGEHSVELSQGRIELAVDEGSQTLRVGVAEGAAEVKVKLSSGERQLLLQAGQMLELPKQPDSVEAKPFKEYQIAPREKDQLDYAVELVRNVGLESALPANAVARDAVDLLAGLGLVPCAGVWDPDKPLCLDDIQCVSGLPPEILFPTLDDQVRSILDNYEEIFWLQNRRTVSVSPFAP